MKVKIDAINIHAGTQARQGIVNETVDKYAECMIEGDTFPPVVLFHDGSGYYIGDGHHRVLASMRNDFIDIEAEVRAGTQQDALWYALGANRINGQGMSKGDIRHAVAVALKTWPEKTQQAIADQVGCSIGTVNGIKQVIFKNENHSIPDTIVNAQGRTRPTTYQKHESDVTTNCNIEPEKEMPDETGEEKREEATTIEKPKRMKYTPPCMGLQYARIAIMNLENIQENDTERKEAIETVRRWIDANDK